MINENTRTVNQRGQWIISDEATGPVWRPGDDYLLPEADGAQVATVRRLEGTAGTLLGKVASTFIDSPTICHIDVCVCACVCACVGACVRIIIRWTDMSGSYGG